MSIERMKCLIIGARGYSGQELARLLLKHPCATLSGVGSTDPDWRLSEALPEEAAKSVPTVLLPNLLEFTKKEGIKTIFLATPTETSLEMAPQFLENGIHVIDLSGAFRLTPEIFQKAYGLKHPHPEFVKTPPYGLAPWSAPPKNPTPGKGTLISNPGCYATASQMALIPLLKDGLLSQDMVVIDAKSGASGGGRKASETFLYTQVAEDCLPYRVGNHQHEPEISEGLRLFSGQTPRIFFTTHLLAVRRGILASIYGRLKEGVAIEEIDRSFQNAYSNYPLVHAERLCDGRGKERTSLLSLRRVAGSARTHLTYQVRGDQLFLFSTIDNLLKGAASQAVENLNALMGNPFHTGLLNEEGLL